ncbi:hypothetical protein ANN_25103 [Periplaneta americana]|uniref:Uncharacterized protein n=1 Tax=Periplaneta americana TaxID=6978 RepID=A0ABQ8S0I4_PERAM|nr:hypothetical protein ANN_25103 [Periplaneta americana]
MFSTIQEVFEMPTHCYTHASAPHFIEFADHPPEVRAGTGTVVLFDHTKVINKSSHYWDRTIKEAIEIKLEKNNFNRDSGLQLSQAWTPALDQLRPSYNQGHEDHGPRTATDSNRRNRARRPPNFTQ